MEYRQQLLVMGAVFLAIILIMLLVARLRPRERYPYEPRDLLTKREAAFYQILAPIAEDYGWTLFLKLRLADILGVRSGEKNYMSYFNKIKAKHTDFVLCDAETLEVLVGVELDDPSHERPDRMERDEFVDRAYEAAGIPLLHEWLPEDKKELARYPMVLEQHLLQAIGLEWDEAEREDESVEEKIEQEEPINETSIE